MSETRPLRAEDADAAIGLYRELVGEGIAVADAARFAEVLAHPGTQVLGACRRGEVLAVATLHVLPNMTFGGRPYALIENVVTRADSRGQGMGRAVMQAAIEAAWAVDAYKIMLLTGRALGARGFYETLGFSGDEKHAMTLRRAPPRNPRTAAPPAP